MSHYFLKVGSYHASSLLVASRPPTPGVVSRGIGMEGVSSVLASLWGTGVGSTTLTENVHTIAVTKMGSRRAVELGAIILILLSFVGRYFFYFILVFEHPSDLSQNFFETTLFIKLGFSSSFVRVYLSTLCLSSAQMVSHLHR